jgi:hypothetical protein
MDKPGFIHRLVIAAVIAGATAVSAAAPDENELGKSDGYPVQSLSAEFSMMNERYKVGTFSNMEKVFWPRTDPATGIQDRHRDDVRVADAGDDQ